MGQVKRRCYSGAKCARGRDVMQDSHYPTLMKSTWMLEFCGAVPLIVVHSRRRSSPATKLAFWSAGVLSHTSIVEFVWSEDNRSTVWFFVALITMEVPPPWK